jgi:anti-sigma regulatory factor (Ser/Thr protein kinase)
MRQAGQSWVLASASTVRGTLRAQGMIGDEGTLNLMLVNQASEIERACTAVEEFVSGRGLSSEVGYAVALTLDEIIANVIRYGYEDGDEHIIRVRVWLDDDILSAQVADDGKPFNPLLKPAPDLDLPIDQRPIGGLGIHIMRTMMDDIEYRRLNGQNVLTVRKRVERVDPGTFA